MIDLQGFVINEIGGISLYLYKQSSFYLENCMLWYMEWQEVQLHLVPHTWFAGSVQKDCFKSEVFLESVGQPNLVGLCKCVTRW